MAVSRDRHLPKGAGGSRSIAMRPRAFTLLEMITALIMLAVLLSISVATLSSVYTTGQVQAAKDKLQLAVSDARRVASLPGNHYIYPANTISLMAVPAPLSVSASAAGAGNVISGTVVSLALLPNKVLFVTYMNGVCLAALDSTTGAGTTWGQESTTSARCVASNFSTFTGWITGTKASPSTIYEISSWPTVSLGAGVTPTNTQVDSSGNVYMAGNYSTSTITIGTTTLTNAGAGGNFFLAKFNATGTLVWAKSFGGATYDSMKSMTLDASGNFYLVGSYSSATVNFGNSVTISNTDTVNGTNGAFVLKLDSTGTAQWALGFGYGGTNGSSGEAVAVDSSGNVYAAGTNNVATTIGSVTLSFNSSDGSEDNLWLLKLSSSGTPTWGKSYWGAKTSVKPRALVTDSSGNVYMAGNFVPDGGSITGATTVNFSTTLSDSSTDGNDFLAEWNTSGTQQYAYQFGTNGNLLLGLAIDSANNLYLTGLQSQNITWPGGVTTSWANARTDFVVKMNAVATTTAWGVSFFEASGNAGWGAYSPAVDSSGNVWLELLFRGGVTIGSTTYTQANYTNAVVKLSPTGTVSSSVLLSTNADASVTTRRLSLDSAGNAFTGDYFVSGGGTIGSASVTGGFLARVNTSNGAIG